MEDHSKRCKGLSATLASGLRKCENRSMELPNAHRNKEVTEAVEKLRDGQLDLGPQSAHHAGIANTLASLNVAESLQITSLQIEQSAAQNRTAIHKATQDIIGSNEKLAKSNERYVRAMMWLTGGLVLVGIAQIIASFLSK